MNEYFSVGRRAKYLCEWYGSWAIAATAIASVVECRYTYMNIYFGIQYIYFSIYVCAYVYKYMYMAEEHVGSTDDVVFPSEKLS